MANKLVLVYNNGCGGYLKEFISETIQDVAALPVDCFPASKTYCVENKKYYILDLNGLWVEYSSGNEEQSAAATSASSKGSGSNENWIISNFVSKTGNADQTIRSKVTFEDDVTIGNLITGPKYELIEVIDTFEDFVSIARDKDAYNSPYNFSNIEIQLMIPKATTNGLIRISVNNKEDIIKINNGISKNAANYSTVNLDVIQFAKTEHPRLQCSYVNNTNAPDLACPCYRSNIDNISAITSIHVIGSVAQPLPAGSIIKIYGVRK